MKHTKTDIRKGILHYAYLRFFQSQILDNFLCRKSCNYLLKMFWEEHISKFIKLRILIISAAINN